MAASLAIFLHKVQYQTSWLKACSDHCCMPDASASDLFVSADACLKAMRTTCWVRNKLSCAKGLPVSAFISMTQQVASGIHKSSKAPAYLEDPVKATVDVTELFPAVPGAEPPFALFVASVALLHAAAYSSGGSVTLLCLRLYDPTQTNLSLSA